MKDNLNELLGKLKELENELHAETNRYQKQFDYEVSGQKIHFNQAVARQHQSSAKKFGHYFSDLKFSSFITTPVILSCIIPVLLLDLWATFYQAICFPAYEIPKVQRKDYIILDRGRLPYLNSIQRLSCAYCGYVNGAIAYAQEIAGRTEQYWCPIKHALRVKIIHSRYAHFLDYGDAKQYRTRLDEVRRAFDDLKQNKKTKFEQAHQMPRGFSSADFERIR